MNLPTYDELYQASSLLSGYLDPTPQYKWPLLCQRCGTEVWVKHENLTPIGSFKVRGGINYLSKHKAKQVISATRGNHGQSVAYAARLFGAKATIVVPHGNSTVKNESMKAWGAELIEYGIDFNEALDYARDQANEQNMHFVPSFHRDLVIGVSSYALELFQAVPDLDVLYVPIGLGSEICAAIAARQALGRNIEIIGAVAANAPTYALSFEHKKAVETEPGSGSIADGVSTRIPDKEALQVILQYVSRIVSVSESEIANAMRHYFTDVRHVIEGAGAVTLAALLQEKTVMTGKKVGLVASGGNVEINLYKQILAGTYKTTD